MEYPVQRILARVDLSDLRACVIWPGSKSQGYGKVKHLGKCLWVHRLLYEHFHGPIPEGYTVDHLCHNEDIDCPGGVGCPHRACVNWQHLGLKTNRENLDAADRPRQRGLYAAFCARGHPWADNERWMVRGSRGGTKAGKRERYCASCNRERV